MLGDVASGSDVEPVLMCFFRDEACRSERSSAALNSLFKSSRERNSRSYVLGGEVEKVKIGI